jgi:hypothetical protein
MGFSSMAADRTTVAYTAAFATAAQYGDILLIQRAPPWAEFLPGASVSTQTAETTRYETALLDQYRSLRRFYAIDPTDPAVRRSRIAGLPAGVAATTGFSDPQLRQAFIAYVMYVVTNYAPDYLAIGVEINMLYERSPQQFEAFVTLYREAYAVAKTARPQMLVFPTFQLEDLEGTLDTAHSPHWEVLDPFRGAMDALAVSTYPYVNDAVQSARDVRADYFSQLATHFEGPVIIAETAWPSAPVEGETILGTEADQRAYLERLLADAERHGIAAVVWLAALDPAWAQGGPQLGLRDLGLRRSDGGNKAAWAVWEAWARRPLVE